MCRPMRDQPAVLPPASATATSVHQQLSTRNVPGSNGWFLDQQWQHNYRYPHDILQPWVSRCKLHGQQYIPTAEVEYGTELSSPTDQTAAACHCIHSQLGNCRSSTASIGCKQQFHHSADGDRHTSARNSQSQLQEILLWLHWWQWTGSRWDPLHTMCMSHDPSCSTKHFYIIFILTTCNV